MDKLKLKGSFTGILRHKDGSVEVRRKDNLILNVGFDFIADAIGKADSRPACMGYTAVGTGTDETAPEQTALVQELARKPATYEHTAGTERKRRDLGKCTKEKIKPAERLSRSLTTLAGSESITTQETYWDLINYLLKVVENANIADDNTNGTVHAENERVAIADSRTINLSSLTLEQVAMIDQALRHAEFHKGFDEAVKAMEFHANHVETKAKEQTSIKEYRRQDMKQGSREHGDFLETLRYIANMKREFAESVNAGEGYAAYYTERQQEEFHTKDKKFHAADGVLGDVAVKKGAMDMDAFKILVNQPAGYEHFIPYIVGEYEYQKALVRLSIEAGSAGAEPAVYDAVIHVDIDDTVDRGKMAITDTSKATRIHFSKHYYTKPEVAVALYSGNTKDGAITPNITDINKDDAGYYFEVELLKDDYTRTTGTISWQAVGY